MAKVLRHVTIIAYSLYIVSIILNKLNLFWHKSRPVMTHCEIITCVSNLAMTEHNTWMKIAGSFVIS